MTHSAVVRVTRCKRCLPWRRPPTTRPSTLWSSSHCTWCCCCRWSTGLSCCWLCLATYVSWWWLRVTRGFTLPPTCSSPIWRLLTFWWPFSALQSRCCLTFSVVSNQRIPSSFISCFLPFLFIYIFLNFFIFSILLYFYFRLFLSLFYLFIFFFSSILFPSFIPLFVHLLSFFKSLIPFFHFFQLFNFIGAFWDFFCVVYSIV